MHTHQIASSDRSYGSAKRDRRRRLDFERLAHLSRIRCIVNPELFLTDHHATCETGQTGTTFCSIINKRNYHNVSTNYYKIMII